MCQQSKKTKLDHYWQQKSTRQGLENHQAGEKKAPGRHKKSTTTLPIWNRKLKIRNQFLILQQKSSTIRSTKLEHKLEHKKNITKLEI